MPMEIPIGFPHEVQSMASTFSGFDRDLFGVVQF
jgi:hypothetical protein